MKRFLLLAAVLATPLAMAAGTGPTYPDDPHNSAPKPGADSTLNPIETPMPRNTDPRLNGNDPDSPPASQSNDHKLPGMGTPDAPVGTGQGSGSSKPQP